jgi:hypothetical protein
MTIAKTTIHKMTIDKMTIDKMTNDKMTIDRMTIDKMTIVKMIIDKMTKKTRCCKLRCLGEMSLYKMTYCQNFYILFRHAFRLNSKNFVALRHHLHFYGKKYFKKKTLKDILLKCHSRIQVFKK